MAKTDNLQDYLTALGNSFRYATNSTEKINAQDMLELPKTLGDSYKDLQKIISRNYNSNDNIVVPLGIESIGEYAYGFSSMARTVNKIIIPEGVKYAGLNSFGKIWCKEIHIPSTFVNADPRSFLKPNSSNKGIIYYNGTLEQFHEMPNYYFFGQDSLKHSEANALNVDNNVYIKNEPLIDIVIPKEKTEIAYGGIYSKNGVCSFEENSSVTKISSLPLCKKIYFPKGPFESRNNYSNYQYEEIHYDGNMEDYLKITYSTTSYSYYNFFSCPNAKIYFKGVLQEKIVIPDTIVTIPDQAFYGFDKSVKEVVIPSSVSEILKQSFVCSTSSSGAVVRLLGTTPPTRQSNSFGGISKYIVPASALNTYKTATNWSRDASIIFPDSNIEVSIDSSLLNNENILYSVDGGAKQQFTNTTLSLEGVGTLTIYNTSTDTIKLGKTSGGSEVGTSGPSTTITYTFTDVSTLYITKA